MEPSAGDNVARLHGPLAMKLGYAAETELSLDALALALESVGMVTLDRIVGVLEALRLDGRAGQVLETWVLSRLDPLDRLSLGQVSKEWRALVKSVPAFDAAPGRRKISEFVGSVERFAWATSDPGGCPWWGFQIETPQSAQTPPRPP